MNLSNLDILFRNYIAHFEVLNNDEHEEYYKWNAVGCAQKMWDMEAEDFAAMLKRAFGESHTLINNRITQPVSGLVALAEADAEFVRGAFARLLAQDGGDLAARQARMEAFEEECNARLLKLFPEKWRYKQDRRSVICYLALLRPQENYMFKSTPAIEFARYMEYGDEIGTGEDFRLGSYYAMCDRLVEYARTSPELMAADASRRADWKDESLHVLAYDLIYCMHAYDLKNGMKQPPVRARSASAKQREFRRQQAAQLRAELDDLQDALDDLQMRLNALEEHDFTGERVESRAFGVVTVLRQEGRRLYFEVQGAEKSFSLPGCVARGFIRCDAALTARYREEMQIREQMDALDGSQKLKQMQLAQYED